MSDDQSKSDEGSETPSIDISSNYASKYQTSRSPRIPVTDKNHPQLTRRHLAEIQLDGILHNPELSLPIFNDDVTVFKIDDLATRLQAQPWFVTRLVSTLGVANPNLLSMRDVHAITRVLSGSFDARALVFFKMIDTDDDHLVTRPELFQFFKNYTDDIYSLSTFDEENSEDHHQVFLDLILEKFHLNKTPHIDFDYFYEVVVNDKLLIEIFSRFTVHPNWFAEDSPQKKKNEQNGTENQGNLSSVFRTLILTVLRNKVKMYQSLYDSVEEKLSTDYFYGNVSRVLFLFIYLAMVIALIIYVIIYRIQLHTHWLEVIARICGMQLNFNCTLMIVLMLRRTATFIRKSSRLYALVPVDDTVVIHSTIGRWIVVLASIHILCHTLYFGVHGNGHTWAEIMFTARGKVGRLNIAPLMGIVLTSVFSIMFICSMKFVRRGGHFELFYWTHLLYTVFYTILLIHSPNFWCWFIGPGAIFVFEKAYSLFKDHSKSKGRTTLHSVTIEEANVMKLTIVRPSHFNFMAGDYVFLNIPQVARYEWHPFTLSSAPEDKQVLTIHMQSVGNWTAKVFKRYKGCIDENSKTFHSNSQEAPLERIQLDGPYATSARYISNSSHAILIGAGIGVTPYASVLSSLLAQYRLQNGSGTTSDTQRHLMKVDFIWINRSIRNFEWFLKLLASFEQEQELYEKMSTIATDNRIQRNGRFLDIHLYFTDIKKEDIIGFVPLNMVARVYEQAYQKDIFTQLKAKTHVGRPEWSSLFAKILARDGQNKKRDADVFFCGPKTMAETVREECVKHAIYFHKEQF